MQVVELNVSHGGSPPPPPSTLCVAKEEFVSDNTTFNLCIVL